MIPEDETRAQLIGMVGAALLLAVVLLMLHAVTTRPDRVGSTVVTVTPATASEPVPAVIKEER